ncbi:(2Fe-2S)-binding protein [Streptomyces sp. NBC_01190]|uniref:(2Fe-2S)-binding protein n=1 Tax=Streptomyces sp. NBC_01190 TaxID=2903767 RepID=UPI003869B1E2|nr:(2Fe-2S)-binding protein [Streptomyces sp. NBC_01190]
MPVITSCYARVTAVHPGLVVSAADPRTGAGWTTAGELAEGGPRTAAFVARETARMAGEYGRAPRPDVAATLALHRYLWPACLLFTAPWFLRRRVPRLPVGDVSAHAASGRMTVRLRAFTCLPGDPAARLPGARTVPDEAALRTELRDALTEHLAPVLGAFRPLSRRGPVALWRMATDEITQGLWHVGRLLGEEDRAVAELSALLPDGAAPFAGGAGFAGRHTGEMTSDTPSDHLNGNGGWARTRQTCCLFYTISPTSTCVGCPRGTNPDPIDRRASAA